MSTRTVTRVASAAINNLVFGVRPGCAELNSTARTFCVELGSRNIDIVIIHRSEKSHNDAFKVDGASGASTTLKRDDAAALTQCFEGNDEVVETAAGEVVNIYIYIYIVYSTVE